MIWSDHETDKDLLGNKHLVDVISGLTKSPHLLPATIGVFGDWGSGKSSLLKMVASELTTNENNLVLTFNGWLFEGYDDAKAALMETILEGISKRTKLTIKAKKLILSLLGRVKEYVLPPFSFREYLAYKITTAREKSDIVKSLETLRASIGHRTEDGSGVCGWWPSWIGPRVRHGNKQNCRKSERIF